MFSAYQKTHFQRRGNEKPYGTAVAGCHHVVSGLYKASTIYQKSSWHDYTLKGSLPFPYYWYK